MWKLKCTIIPVNRWSHWNSNEKLKEKSESCTRKTFYRFATKDSYAWNITHNTESTAVWSLEPERWGSPLVQDKYQEEMACDKRHPYIIIIIIIIIIITTTTDTQFAYWFLFTYPFLILHSLIPHSIITNLHIFLSFSYSFLLVAGWWLSSSCRCFLPLRESQNIRRHFYDLQNPEHLGIKPNFAGLSSLKLPTSGPSQGNCYEWEPYPRRQCRPWYEGQVIPIKLHDAVEMGIWT